MKFKIGDQIAYIPRHVQCSQAEALKHPDVEFGFIMRVSRANEYFCRYWMKGDPGVLRTTSYSEGTPGNCMVKHKSVKQDRVAELMQWIWLCEEGGK